jgi:RNA polymerase sigma factor for flagellar operon FliA
MDAAFTSLPDPVACTAAHSVAENEVLVERYGDLVRVIAGQLMRHMPRHVDIEDLIQNGMVGLLEAAQRYESRRGASFTTYATRRVRGAMLDGSRRSDWCSRSLRRLLRAIHGARWRIECENSVAAKAPAIAEALGITLQGYFCALRDSSLSVQLSLDEPGSVCAAGAPREPVDRRPGPEEALERDGMVRALAAAVDALPEVERVIYILYYDQDYLMREIGEVLSVSESRVCQIHKRTLKRLRAAAR